MEFICRAVKLHGQERYLDLRKICRSFRKKNRDSRRASTAEAEAQIVVRVVRVVVVPIAHLQVVRVVVPATATVNPVRTAFRYLPVF